MSLSLTTILLLGCAAAMCICVFVWGVHLLTAKAQVAADLTSAAPKKSEDEDEIFILHRITQGLGRPLLPTIKSKLSDQQLEKLDQRIQGAGSPEGLTVDRYISRKAGEVLLYGSVAVIVLIKGSPLFAMAILVFTFMTEMRLISERGKRQEQIQKQLPDFLDVLAVTVGAGLSFRQALARVSDSMPGLLATEFRTALHQMDLGTSRRDAFKELRKRNNNESLGRFVTALQQAEELGAPLADALMTISGDIRRDDAQFLRRKAQKVSPRVTGVTAATMLPGLLLVVGGGMFLGMDLDFSMFGG
ncbi:type II secretion system F family protein [Nocardiopsis sp. RSe5-2]|uniref:Type II secretion system F family protein n=1 Tax=Nocardiopsis endophytica TaxID=3018445 RepID=A0ABT4U2H5_9ACTN|nr:type II secretion system F family protein [Nocardiopsis endophytica]MDA2811139.1 type II secretion system F family protein [Nocardiopsis endophytica]